MLEQHDHPAWTFFVAMCVFLPACFMISFAAKALLG